MQLLNQKIVVVIFNILITMYKVFLICKIKETLKKNLGKHLSNANWLFNTVWKIDLIGMDCRDRKIRQRED